MIAKKQAVPAVGYVRMSSGRQEASPQQQRTEIKKLAEREGYRIIRWYSDEAVSGDDTGRRKAFQQMVADTESKGDFTAILCWDQDRFGRFDSIEAGRWIYPLRQAGVWLHTVSQGCIDWNDFAGRMIYSIQQEGKHSFLLDLSRNVLRGKLESARKGRGAASVPYGYDRQFSDGDGKPVKLVLFGEKFTKPKEWSVRFVESQNTEAAETVRWIFRTFADSDCGQTRLATELNQRGVPSPKGGKWSVQAIENILTRQIYVGSFVWGTRRSGKYHHTGDDGEIMRGPGCGKSGAAIVVEGVHDQIIAPKLFADVQAKIASRKLTGRAPRYSRYLLSGIVRCGHCGAPLAGKGYSKKNIPRYYICTAGATQPGACRRYQVPQAELDDYILGVVEKCLFAEDVVDRIRNSIYRQAKQRKGHKTKTATLQSKLNAMDAKIRKGRENLLLAGPEHVAELSRLLSEWKAERDGLQEQLEQAAINPGGLSAEKLAEKAIAELEHLREIFHEENPAAVRTVIKSLIEDLAIYWEPYGKRSHRMAYGVLTYRGAALDIATSASRGR